MGYATLGLLLVLLGRLRRHGVMVVGAGLGRGRGWLVVVGVMFGCLSGASDDLAGLTYDFYY